MGFTLTPQQKQIFEQLRKYQIPAHYERVASDLGLSAKGVQSQLGKLREFGLVKEVEEKHWQVTEDAQQKLEEAGEDTTVTLEDVHATPKQHFTQFGRTWGINPERLQVMVNTIWTSGDPENLDHVWDYLGKLQVSPDVKRIWVTAWQAYLAQSDPEKLKWQPPTTVQEKVAEVMEKKEVQKQIEKIEEEGPKEWIVDVKKNEPVKIGEPMGLYSLKEAKELVQLRMYRETLEGGRTEGVAAEKISDILTALVPYLTKEGQGEEATKLIRELFEEKLSSGLRELAIQIPHGDQKPWWETLPQILTAVAGVGPTLKTLLGIPDAKDITALIESRIPHGDSRPLEMKNPDGTPFVFTKEMMEFWRFNADQKREEEKHKQQMDIMGGLRDFMGKIGTAATRLAAERER